MKPLYKIFLIFVLVFISCQPLPENGKWTEINTTIKPEARCGFEMVNAEDKKIILFGGGCDDTYFSGIWEFDISPNIWRKIEPTINPNERAIFGMAYGGKVDNKNRIIIFSGFYEDIPYLSDTWEYNVEDEIWTQCNNGIGPGNTSPLPTPRMRHSMEYIGNNKIFLFGGQDEGGILFNNLWEYDVSTHTWSEISIAGTDKPQGRQDCGMTFNPESRRVVIFGGWVGLFEYVNDTWEYDVDEKIWTQYSPSYKPSKRAFLNIVYIGNNKVMLFGGENPSLGYVNDTWIYDMTSHTWASCIIQDTKPIRRGEYGMIGLLNQKAYLFGGATNADTKDLINIGDMWLFELLE